MKYSALMTEALSRAEALLASSNCGRMTPDLLLLGLTELLLETDTAALDALSRAEAEEASRLLDERGLEPERYDAYRDFVLSFDVGAHLFYNEILEVAEEEARLNEHPHVSLVHTVRAILTHLTESMTRFLFPEPELIPLSEEGEKEKKLSLSEAIASLQEKLILSKPKPSVEDEDEEDENEGEEEDDYTKKINELLAYLDEDDEDDEDDEARALFGAEALAALMDNVKDVRKRLLDAVFGQDAAVNAFVSGYFKASLDARFKKDRKKPKATFLFAGPPGVGKTFLAETAAEALGLPFARFDMSEYADKEANIEFCGSDKVYKNGKVGNVTSFVSEHPECVLLFDEVEKAHLSVIYLFLQMLDAGRLRDNYTDEEVSFRDTIIILTTNAGKNLYGETAAPLSSLSRKRIIKALGSDKNPQTSEPLFPAAICSRFASGNVVMFDHLGAGNLFRIARRELMSDIAAFEEGTGIGVRFDESVTSAIIFSEGGKADARTVKGRAGSFFHEEMYELLRLIGDKDAIARLKDISFTVTLPEDGEILKLFGKARTPSVLVLSDTAVTDSLAEDGFTLYKADTFAEAKEILFRQDISLVLCDVCCGARGNASYLNLEDVASEGRDLLTYVTEKYDIPLFLLEREEDAVSEEERLSFARLGARGSVGAYLSAEEFCASVLEKTDIAVQQSNMELLAKASKVLRYKTAQTVSEDGEHAEITLFGLCLALAADAEDEKALSATVSRPSLRFSDVIGAEDAKEELKYFVSYLKNPTAFMRKGVGAPKGVLLYGPPGTGKTMLAKAMAGESDVTFLVAEGNSFLKRYVGEGADAIHAVFATARKYAPSILFIDEIDAIGRERTGADTTGDVLTALLTEMDGFAADTAKPVFVLAATNYGVDGEGGKTLDAALLRRFDRKLLVDLPTKEERLRYIRYKMEKMPALALGEEQIENVAVRSTGMSLALLSQVIELALRNAIRSENNSVDDAAFEEAFETYQGGERKKWDDSLLLRVARHEAGHALVSYLGGECPSYLTVVARGSHGGYMQHADSEGKALFTRRELLDRIRTSLGGRAAETVCYGREGGVSTGASGDLQSATAVARQMICVYGMDEVLGLAAVTDSLTAAAEGEVRARINAILSKELEEAVRLIEENRLALDALAEALMTRNHLKGNEIEAILKPFKK